jgi:hypothetical protein
VFDAIAKREAAHTSASTLVIMDPNRGKARQMDGLSWEEAFQERGYEVLLGIDDLNFGHSQLREMLATNEPQMRWMENLRGQDGPIYQMSHYTWDNYSRKLAFERGPKEKPKAKYKDFPDIFRYVACAHLEYSVLAGGHGYETINLRKAKSNAAANPYLHR